MSGSATLKTYLVGVRLSREDKNKLDQLCLHTQRQTSDLLRVLIRNARLAALPVLPLEFAGVHEDDAAKDEVP
jgi:hypothetical protein